MKWKSSSRFVLDRDMHGSGFLKHSLADIILMGVFLRSIKIVAALAPSHGFFVYMAMHGWQEEGSARHFSSSKHELWHS